MVDPNSAEGARAASALLRRFDRELLAATLADAGPALEALLASAWVEPDPHQPALYRLRPGLAAEAERQVRSLDPQSRLALHTRAFLALVDRLADPAGPGPDWLEEQCFFHLDWLFNLLALRLEWRTCAAYVGAAGAIPLRDPTHRQLLTLYEAILLIRSAGAYERGAALLARLLASPGLATHIYLQALSARGTLERYLTHYDMALATFDHLAEAARSAASRTYQGLALINKGTIHHELEEYERALALALESLALFTADHDLERSAYASYSAGLNAMYLGRWGDARRYYDEAIRLFELLQMGATLAYAYGSQGFLNMLLGDPAASEAAYAQAIERSQPPHGDPMLTLDALWLQGFLFFTQARHAEALLSYARATQLATQGQHQHRIGHLHFLRARALQALGRVDEAGAAYAAAMDSVDAMRGAHTKEDVKIALLGTAQQLYEAAALFYLEQGRAAEAFAVAERARARAFLDSLAARAPELFDAFDQPTAALAEIQAALPPDAVLLAYYTTGVLPAGEHFYHAIPPQSRALLERLLLPAGVVLFAVTRDGLAAHRLALDPNSLRPTAGDPRPGRHLVRDRVLASLYERLLGPVERLLEGRASLFIVPHGPLHAVPFMALRSRDGRHLVRAGGPAIALAPSATVLVRNCLGRAAAPASAEALAVGFNGAGGAALRFAEPEAHMAARALGGRALTGAAARAAALVAAGGRLRALHIAGHAAFQPDDPLGSYLALAGGDRLSARAIMGGAGLRADLVVLSACTSGLSHVVPGDELLGLQRAWLYAGAAAVVCALWEAPDLVTLLVMERFYAALAAGSGPGAALRDALVAVRSLTGRELAATFERWRAADPALAAAGALPVIPPELDGRPLYADPVLWAPFMLIGRP